MCPPTTPVKGTTSKADTGTTNTKKVIFGMNNEIYFNPTTIPKELNHMNDNTTTTNTKPVCSVVSKTNNKKNSKVNITIVFTMVVLLICSTISFFLGCTVRYYRAYQSSKRILLSYQSHSRTMTHIVSNNDDTSTEDAINNNNNNSNTMMKTMMITTSGASIPTINEKNEIHHIHPTKDSVPSASTMDITTRNDNNHNNNVVSDLQPKYTYRNFVMTLPHLYETVVSSNSYILQPDGSHEPIQQHTTAILARDDEDTNSTTTSQTVIVQDELDIITKKKMDDQNYEPSGQHLLIDIINVDVNFLRSEERLTNAMMELIQQRTNMTLLSYHCHENIDSITTTTSGGGGGISCAGILLESHVSFHTFPIFNSIAFDLFSCGSSPLLSLLSDIQQLFAIPSSMLSLTTGSLDDYVMRNMMEKYNSIIEDDLVDNYDASSSNHTTTISTNTTDIIPSELKNLLPRITWNFKRRGFRNNVVTTASSNKLVSVAAELPDLHWMLSMSNIDKVHIATVQTEYQRIDIYDMKNFINRPSDQIDRIVYLDGIIQSRYIGEHAYHEALVHPVMICHNAPKRVIIIGGGEGATLREVLKHTSVEEVIMVEIDEIMVSTSQLYLPEWSTCANQLSCFDDPRTTVYYTDAIAWFIHRFGVNSTIYDENDVFDIIIMDALDPDSVLEFSDFLYKNRDLMYAFYRALGDDGIFVAQVGEVESMNDLPESFFPDNPLTTFLNGLESFGFESILEYSESHGRFIESWGFVVAMKDRDSRTNWFRNDALINYEIAQRISESTPLLFFDGPTMMTYQYTSRIAEEIWCRDKDVEECSNGHGFDPYKSHLPHTAFEVQSSTIAKGGRGVFAKQFIPKGTVIGLEECVNGMFLPSTTYDLIRKTANEFDKEGENDSAVSDFWKVVFFGYIDGYGWVDSVYGLPAGGVDPGIMTFVNHGCNGTYNVGTPLDVNEMTAVLGEGPGDAYDDVNDVFHPYNDRQFPHWECEKFTALRDIQAGEELFDNYLVFGGGDDIDDWDKNLMELRSVCMGKAGTIAEYEAAAAA